MTSHSNLPTIGVIGLGFVGGAIKDVFAERGYTVKGYDLYKESDEMHDVVKCDLIFLCLPTVFSSARKEYNKKALISSCAALKEHNYSGPLLIKCTVEPGTTAALSKQFPTLKLVHNPEFLTAATAKSDFENQDHIVIGASSAVDDADVQIMTSFYQQAFPGAQISHCTSTESESMKIFANSFYAVKIQFFNEMYALCQKTGADYNKVRDMILKNGWVNPMHTNVPGTDGGLSYGGLCFPKDTNALLHKMRSFGTPSKVLEATIEERNSMRKDTDNCE